MKHLQSMITDIQDNSGQRFCSSGLWSVSLQKGPRLKMIQIWTQVNTPVSSRTIISHWLRTSWHFLGTGRNFLTLTMFHYPDNAPGLYPITIYEPQLQLEIGWNIPKIWNMVMSGNHTAPQDVNLLQRQRSKECMLLYAYKLLLVN